MGYIDVWEHSGGDRYIDADWSPIIEDLYSPELGFMDVCATRNLLRCRGSACVEVMTTLNGSAPSLQRCAKGCVPLEELGQIDQSIRPIRPEDQDQRDMDSQIVTIDQFVAAMALIQKAIASLDRR
ncbi:hypothetical protein CK203_051272 [Vitis vinifera]|uniref:Uncharacterized protein n=1 Tax=Vitis vinifera TaxID=29760 RepID=A0A438H7M7_VITVI|nr:hypothetical protein CK203_051272 [Vitis vinifera]